MYETITEKIKLSRNDARIGEIPIVMHRKNHEPWKVTMDIADWIKFLKAYENHNKKEI